MIVKFLSVFFLVVLQNASFTLVSRARNSDSYLYHGIASVFSNGLYLLVFSSLVLDIKSWPVRIAYVLGAVAGSVIMHWVSKRFLESKFKKKGA